MKKCVAVIKGEKWQCRIMPDSEFNKLHPDRKDEGGVTYFEKNVIRRIDFCKTYFTEGRVAHEVHHAYHFETHTDSCGLAPDQKEEISSQILEDNWDNFKKVVSEIYQKLK